MTKMNIPSTPEAWEDGPLGKDPAFAGALSQEEQSADDSLINEALGLKQISILLEIELIEKLQVISAQQGINLKTLIRRVLGEFADTTTNSPTPRTSS